jgi:hypothetical protein
VRKLSICPFWSTKKETVSCYNTCPLYSEEVGHEICPFREFLSSSIDCESNNGSLFIKELENEYYSHERVINY